MRKIPSARISYALCLITVFFYAFFLSKSSFITESRLNLVDQLFSLRTHFSKPSPTLRDVVIVGLDDESLRNVNRSWPWGREIFAVFMENLQALNPKTIGMDFAFVGKSTDPQVDDWLASAMARNNNVVIAAYFDPKGHYVKPVDVIGASVRAHGFLEKSMDDDEGTRTAQAGVTDKGVERFSFATWCAAVFRNVSPDEYASGLMNKTYPISYRYVPKDFTYVPFWKIMAKKADPALFKNKLVIVGAVSNIFHDSHRTPLDFMPGVFVNGNDVVMFLDHDLIKEIPVSVYWVIFGLIAAVFSAIFHKTSFVNRFLIYLVALTGIFAFCTALFVQTGYLIDPFHYLAVLTLVYVAVFFIKGLLTFWENVALQRMVIMDGLTGLYAYKYLQFRLETEFEKAHRMKKPFYVVMLDVDFFKKVNDTYGHEQGNHVLISVAKALKSAVRTYDVAGRYGGEEFMLILFHHDEKDVLQMVERIRTNVEREAHTADGKTFNVTLSAGICSNQHPDVQTKDDLIRKADEALYLAKQRGRNRIEVASGQKH